MSTEAGSKINQLLASQPSGVVLLSSWLLKLGYSFELKKRYKQSHWLESIGTGAMKRAEIKFPFMINKHKHNQHQSLKAKMN